MNSKLATRPSPLRRLQGLRHRAHRLRGAVRQLRAAAYERPHLRAFQEFHAALPEKRDVVYMFFTGNLLHWLSRALSFVPPEVNVVLLGAALTPEERAWVTATGRPCHFLAERFDDNTVLDFIFATTQHNFAWLHIDCFVLEPRLFGEMMTFGPDDALNTIWVHPGPPATLHSAFVAVHYAVLAAIRARGIETSPCTYHYSGAPAGRTVTARPLYSRVPTGRHLELLRTIGADDEVPPYPVGDCFEILELYQLTANALGYRLHPVRRMRRDGTAAAEHYSNEILHVNGVSTYRRYKNAAAGKSYIDNQEYQLLLQADYAMLTAMSGTMPPQYRQLRAELEREVAELGVDPSHVARNLTGYLMSRGISAENCARILSPGSPASPGFPASPAPSRPPEPAAAPPAPPAAPFA